MRKRSRDKKHPTSDPRWGLVEGGFKHPYIDPEAVDSALLKQAVDLLRPTSPADRETAQDAILAAAEDYLFHVENHKNAPRPSDVKARLLELHELALRLHRLVHNLDSLTLSKLEDAGLFDHPLVRRMQGHDAPSEHQCLSERKGSVLLSLLKAIGKASEIALASIEQDEGGSSRPFGVSAEDELAGLCLDIFEKARPGEATSAENGDFSIFVAYVSEIATGKQTSVIKPVKRACRNWKAFQKQIAQQFPSGLPDDRFIFRSGADWSIVQIGAPVSFDKIRTPPR